MEIAHKYLIQHYPLADIVQLHQVNPASVKNLARKVQKDSSVLAELHASEQKEGECKEAIITAAAKLDKTPDGILRTEDVITEVKEAHQLDVKSLLVRETMKVDLHLAYRPLKRISFRGNSARCLILRKMFAESMIGLLEKRKRIINVDETWINLKNYRRRRWR